MTTLFWVALVVLAVLLFVWGVVLLIRSVQDRPPTPGELSLDNPEPIWPDAPASERES